MADADDVLQRIVDDVGAVDYAQASHDPDLDASLRQVADADRSAMAQDAEYAFLINAYNLHAIDVARRRLWRPDGRARSLSNPFWRLVFFLLTPIKVAGRWHNLWSLEFVALRPHIKRDPRGHFALVCASTGCPPLREGKYHAQTLNDELDLAARGFMRPGGGYRIDHGSNTLWLNRILKWYRRDFEALGGVDAVFGRYAADEDADFLIGHHPSIKYMPYDWSLNVSRG